MFGVRLPTRTRKENKYESLPPIRDDGGATGSNLCLNILQKLGKFLRVCVAELQFLFDLRLMDPTQIADTLGE